MTSKKGKSNGKGNRNTQSNGQQKQRRRQMVGCLVGWRGGGGWDGLSAGGVGFHQFDAGAVGVEEVDLALAVDAYVHVERLAVSLVCRASFESVDGFLDVGDHEGDVVFAAPLLGWWEGVVEHELDVVLAVGDAEVDPAELFAVGAAAPEFSEAEEGGVEVEGLLAVADEEA